MFSKKATKIMKSSPSIWPLLSKCQTNQRWRFCNFLWAPWKHELYKNKQYFKRKVWDSACSWKNWKCGFIRKAQCLLFSKRYWTKSKFNEAKSGLIFVVGPYVYSEVWYRQIWIQNYLGFIVLILLFHQFWC